MFGFIESIFEQNRVISQSMFLYESTRSLCFKTSFGTLAPKRIAKEILKSETL